jgi:hypothetical protein
MAYFKVLKRTMENSATTVNESYSLEQPASLQIRYIKPDTISE